MFDLNTLARVNAVREDVLAKLEAQRRRVQESIRRCACVHDYTQNNGSRLLACELPDPGCRTCKGSGITPADAAYNEEVRRG